MNETKRVTNTHVKQLVFYIYVPMYRSNSAGIKVLFLLAERLKHLGNHVYLVAHNPSTSGDANPFTVPFLTRDMAERHKSDGWLQVVIYSETVVGNPLRAQHIARYFLNYPGALGGTRSINLTEFNFAYSQRIAQSIGDECIVVFIPAVDLEELPRNIKKDPSLNLVYAGKYRAFIGEPLCDYGVAVTEIFRDGKNRQSRTDVLNLLAAANRIYVWENSTIATEAILLETPVVFIRNPFLGEIIAEIELGKFGYTFSNSESEIEKARLEIPMAKLTYKNADALSDVQLRAFIEKAGCFFRHSQNQGRPIKVPEKNTLLNMHRVRMFLSIVRRQGPLRAMKVVKEFGYFRFRSKSAEEK